MVVKLRNKSAPISGIPPYISVMLYGDPGCGKTIEAGSDDKVLFISPDPKGPVSAKLYGSNADHWPIGHWDDFDECHAYWDAEVRKGNEIPYKWFAVDTLTEVQGLGMDAILQKANAANPSRDPYVPALQDYLKNQAMVRTLVKEFNRLPVNMLYTAWVLQYVDPEGRETIIPDLRGGAKRGYTFSKEICGMMTSFGYLKVRKVEGEESRRIIWKTTVTKADGVLTAKDRTGAFEPHTDDLTLKELRIKVENRRAEKMAEEATQAPVRKATRTVRKATTTRARRASATK
jgi:hypothetical protein